MADSTPKLIQGMTPFTFVPNGEFFHKHSAIGFPVYPNRAESFKLAADMILDAHAVAKKGPHNDHLVFPVLFLYRHGLEVQLKDLLLLAVRCKCYQLVELDKVLQGHQLWPLWRKVKPFLRHNFPKEVKVRFIEPTIQAFQRLDADGQTLRYARTRSQRRHTYENMPDYINVTQLRTTMDAVHYHLDWWYSEILEHHTVEQR